MFAKCDKINGRIWESLGASFVKNKATLEKKLSAKFEIQKTIAEGF